MNRLLVRMLAVGGCLLPLGVVVHGWVFLSGPGGPKAGPELVGEWRRKEALDRHVEARRACEAVRRRVVAEVIAGRMTLREAAAQFGQLYRILKAVPEDTVGARQLPEDEEVLCRDVISWVEPTLRASPASAAVRARLDAEYRQSFNRRPPRPSHKTPPSPANRPAHAGGTSPVAKSM